jgi:hypothetical protein
MRKYLWMEAQTELINWQSLTQALNRKQDKEVLALVKVLAEVTATITA